MISPTAPSLISPTTSPPAHSSPAIFIFSKFEESTQQALPDSHFLSPLPPFPILQAFSLAPLFSAIEGQGVPARWSRINLSDLTSPCLRFPI